MNDRDRTFNVRLKEPEEENLRKLNAFCKGSLSEQNVGISPLIKRYVNGRMKVCPAFATL